MADLVETMISHFAYTRHNETSPTILNIIHYTERKTNKREGLRSQDTGIYVGGEDVNLKDMNIQRNPFA